MFFVKRDSGGRVEALFRNKPQNDAEELPANHPDIVDFLTGGGKETKAVWAEADLGMARVLEDLIVIFLRREVVSFTDLPLEAQQKLVIRHNKRGDLGFVARLFPSSDEDELGD